MAHAVPDHHRALVGHGYVRGRPPRRHHSEPSPLPGEKRSQRGQRADGMPDQSVVLVTARGLPLRTTSSDDGRTADEIRQIDPKLVLPDWAPPLPLHSDLSFHTVPSLTLIADLLFFSPPYTIAFLPALALSVFIAFGYWFWIERCHQVNNFYPYPLFEILGTSQRVGLFCASAVLMTLATTLLAWLYGIVNGKDPGQRKHRGYGNSTQDVRSRNVKGD